MDMNYCCDGVFWFVESSGNKLVVQMCVIFGGKGNGFSFGRGWFIDFIVWVIKGIDCYVGQQINIDYNDKQNKKGFDDVLGMLKGYVCFFVVLC